MLRHVIGGFALLLTALPLSAQTAAAPGNPGPAKVDENTQQQDLRFKNESDDRLTVPVRLSGAGPFRFLVDTGASRTAVSREVAGRLGLASGDAAAIHTVTGVATVGTATLPALELARNAVKVTDAPILESANIGADGILGVDSLSAQRVLFDFKAQTLSIVPSATPDFQDEPGTIIVLAKRRNGRLIVTDALANGRPLTIVIDTGSQVSIGNRALRDQLLGKGVTGGGQAVELQSVTGDTITGNYLSVRTLDMGEVTLKNLVIVFADAHTFKQLNLNRQPALLLGMNAIRAFKKVSIDFAKRRFRVVLPETSALEVQFASRSF